MRTGFDSIRKAIMAIGAHADDLEVHVGGTLLKSRSNGYEIIYVMATNNMSGSNSKLDDSNQVVTHEEPTGPMMARRKRECDLAAAELGTRPIHLDFPQRHYRDSTLQKHVVRWGAGMPETVSGEIPTILTAAEDAPSVTGLANRILAENPECIFTHGPIQVNPEHYSTCLLVTRAYWQAVRQGFCGALLYWLEAHTVFGDFYNRWETHIDYTSFLDDKMRLIGLHACQMPHAHLPNFGHRMLATQWGKTCGVGAAEAFVWVRRSTHLDDNGPVFGELLHELIRNSR